METSHKEEPNFPCVAGIGQCVWKEYCLAINKRKQHGISVPVEGEEATLGLLHLYFKEAPIREHRTVRVFPFH